MWLDMLVQWLPFITLGFGLGFLHALDADHVMAVSALANQNPSVKRTLLFSLHWALGHGGVLLACGVIIFGLGIAIPESLHYVAEILVGLLLILLGLSFFSRSRRLKIALVQHKHDDIEHTHWVTDSHTDNTDKIHHQHSQEQPQEHLVKVHQPVIVGVLHGLAGSAPALALIPAVTSGQLGLALAYLMTFSLGVILSMLVFGLGFSRLQQYLSQYYQRLFIVCRQMVALLAIVFGVLLLIKTS